MGVFGDLVSSAPGWVGVILGGTMKKVGWRPECRRLGCRVVDGICVRRHLEDWRRP